ncbi:hypothetical protein SK128_019055, partial [Halocaridina rubra]
EGSQNSLDQHIIKEHPESRFFKCRICSKAFRTYRYLHFVHFKRCHIGLPIKYHCEKCNKGFTDKSSLENHKLSHSDVKNYSCEFCGALFRTPYSLKVHVNIHTQEKKYRCQICGMAFLRLCNLIGHKKCVHLRDNRYVCEVCGKVIHTQKGFTRHQLLCRWKEKLFECDDIEKSRTKRVSMKEQESPCKYNCGEALVSGFRSQQYLKITHRDGCEYAVDKRSVEVKDVVAEATKSTTDDDENDNNIVVITLKECDPHLYSLEASLPRNQRVTPTGETSQTHVIAEKLPSPQMIVSAQRVELPFLHSTFGSVTTEKIGITTPILFASLTPHPVVKTHAIQEGTAVNSEFLHRPSLERAFPQVNEGLDQSGNNVHSKSTTVVTSGAPNSLEILQEASELQHNSPLRSELLAIPSISASTGPVTYITTWPS